MEVPVSRGDLVAGGRRLCRSRVFLDRQVQGSFALAGCNLQRLVDVGQFTAYFAQVFPQVALSRGVLSLQVGDLAFSLLVLLQSLGQVAEESCGRLGGCVPRPSARGRVLAVGSATLGRGGGSTVGAGGGV